ncbi:MAG: hypothetical protein ACJ745_25305, partial [Actinomycetes bacterium]
MGVGQVLDRLQPRAPQLLQPAQLPGQGSRRVEPQRRVGPAQPAEDGRHRPKPRPARRGRPLLVADRPRQPA